MKSKIDAMVTGEKLYRQMVDAWLTAALVAMELDGDKEASAEFRTAFGRDPKAIIKAVERFPNVFNPDDNPDLFDVLAAIHLSKVKDDDLALGMFANYRKRKSYDELREQVKEAGAKPARAKRDEAGLRERCVQLIEKWNIENKTSEYISAHPDELQAALNAAEANQ